MSSPRAHSAEGRAAAPRRRWLRPLLVCLAGLALYLPDLGHLVARREQEMRVLLTARDMVQTGRWIEPHFRNESRLRKPPLMYWIVGAVYRAGAPFNSAAWSRLPSALAGVAFLAVLYGFGSRLVGRRRAFAAALVAGVSVIVLRQAKLAETDMCLSLFTATSALTGVMALRGASPSWWLASLAAAGLGFLIKGPAAITLPPLAWLAYGLWQRRRITLPFRAPAFWGGLFLCALIALPWYLLIHFRQDAATATQLEAEMAALLVHSKHFGPFYYYAYTLLHAMAPWSLLLPIALVEAVRRARTRTGWGFALIWFTSSVLVLSLLSSKQIHYALLLVAPGSLLVGAAIHSGRRAAHLWSLGVARTLAVLLAVGGLAMLGALGYLVRPFPLLPAALCLVALALALPACCRAGAIEGRLIRITFALAALVPAGLRVDDAKGARGTATRWVALATADATPADTRVTCLGPRASTAAYYVNRPTHFEQSFEEAWKKAPPGSLVLATWDLSRRPAEGAFPVPPVAQRADVSGFAAAFRKPGLP